MLQDSFKGKDIEGLYRTKHPIHTYRKAFKYLRKKKPNCEIKYLIDKNDYDLSALYPRAVFVKKKNRNPNKAETWGKGLTPLATAVSCLMETVEGEFLDEFLKKLDFSYFKMKYLLDFHRASPYEKLLKIFKNNKMNDKFIEVNRLDSDRDEFYKVEISLSSLFLFMTNRHFLGENKLNLKNGIYTCISWGSGAGNSLEEALIHSLMEVFERIARDSVIGPNTPTKVIDIDSINNKLIKNLINDLETFGLKNFRFLDWSVGLDIPSVCLVWEDAEKTYFKIGTGTTREEAFQRAVTEFIQCLGPQKTGEDGSIHLISELESVPRIPYEGVISYEDLNEIEDDNIKNEIKSFVKKFESIGLYTYFIVTHSEDELYAVKTFVFNKKLDKITIDSGVFY